MKLISEALARERANEAAAMFAEMLLADQEALVDRYNALQTIDGVKLPPADAKCLPRHLIPFLAGSPAIRGGEPASQELFEFALKSGVIKVAANAA